MLFLSILEFSNGFWVKSDVNLVFASINWLTNYLPSWCCWHGIEIYWPAVRSFIIYFFGDDPLNQQQTNVENRLWNAMCRYMYRIGCTSEVLYKLGINCQERCHPLQWTVCGHYHKSEKEKEWFRKELTFPLFNFLGQQIYKKISHSFQHFPLN